MFLDKNKKQHHHHYYHRNKRYQHNGINTDINANFFSIRNKQKKIKKFFFRKLSSFVRYSLLIRHFEFFFIFVIFFIIAWKHTKKFTTTTTTIATLTIDKPCSILPTFEGEKKKKFAAFFSYTPSMKYLAQNKNYYYYYYYIEGQFLSNPHFRFL